MLSKQAQRALIGWEAHSPRIITASFRTKQKKVKLNIIQSYTSTNDSDTEDKDEFYNRLQKIVETFRARDILILVGGLDPTIQDMNKSWGYMDCETSLKNKFEVLHELHEKGERIGVQASWQTIKDTLRTACQEVVGAKKHHHKDWITPETLGKIEERKQKKVAVNNSRTRVEKANAQVEYAEVHRAVKKSIRKDKKDYIDGLAAEAEQAAYNGNMKQLYNTTKKLSGKYSTPERTVKDKEVKVITILAQQMNRLSEHFKELLNRPAPLNPRDINPANEDLPINCSKPTREEIRKAITL
ncbi:Hypothetical predicted protein [Pelobates cultripes]|uniref:Uncharacterized protein n=1 Tax=Pelobates cultripes TaxID=61616 RepID=A0AAD1R6H6_PELCU|nr:Hypothetical predicted protein [Pelobates cultripes]